MQMHMGDTMASSARPVGMSAALSEDGKQSRLDNSPGEALQRVPKSVDAIKMYFANQLTLEIFPQP